MVPRVGKNMESWGRLRPKLQILHRAFPNLSIAAKFPSVNCHFCDRPYGPPTPPAPPTPTVGDAPVRPEFVAVGFRDFSPLVDVTA